MNFKIIQHPAQQRLIKVRYDLIKELTANIPEHRLKPNGGLMRYVFGKYLSNLVQSTNRKAEKVMLLDPERLSNPQLRYLKRVQQTAHGLGVPMAEVMYIGRTVEQVSHIPTHTLVKLGEALYQLDQLTNATNEPLYFHILKAYSIHLQGLS